MSRWPPSGRRRQLLLPEVQARRAADVDRLLRTLQATRFAREARRQTDLDAAAGVDDGAEVLSDLLSDEAGDAVAQRE